MARPSGAVTSTRPIIFGEVLFDKFPDGSVVMGGAPFNVAWHLQAFGMNPLMISRVGDDPLGREIRDTMLAWDMDTSGMQMDSLHRTGAVDVTFVDDEPHFDIVPDRAYDHIDPELLPPLPGDAIIYHGSLVLRNETSREALQKLKHLTGAPVFMDINLRPPWWTETTIKQALHDCHWLKLNEQELELIVPEQATTEDRIKFLMHKLSVECLIATLGSKGAVIMDRSGNNIHAAPEEKTNTVDTVGAGDAFSSVILLGQLKDWPLSDTLQRAQQFASAIVGIRGATIENREFYQPFVNDWRLAE